LLLLLLIPLLRRRERYFVFLAVAAATVSLLTPLLFSLPVEKYLPWAFSGYVKRLPFSQFPLFPWIGYAFLGAAVSWLWQESRKREGEERFFRMLFAAGASLVAVFLIIVLQPFTPVVLGTFHPAKPLFFFLKLGLVVMLLSLLWHWEQKNGNRPAPVTAVGQESLPAYAFHIAVIYGGFSGPFGHSLAFLIGPHRSWAAVALMSLALILITVLVSLAWHWLKKNRPKVAKWVFWGSVIALISYMVFRY